MHAPSFDGYRVQVARVFSGRSTDPVFNGTVDHARIVTEEAFKAAQSSVSILAKRLAAPQFECDEVIGAAQDFVAKPNARLSLLVEREVDLELDPFLRAVTKVGGDRVEIRRVPADVQSRYDFNFLTVDGEAMRFQDDRNVPIAIVGGGAPFKETVNHLDSVFAELWELSERVLPA